MQGLYVYFFSPHEIKIRIKAVLILEESKRTKAFRIETNCWHKVLKQPNYKDDNHMLYKCIHCSRDTFSLHSNARSLELTGTCLNCNSKFKFRSF